MDKLLKEHNLGAYLTITADEHLNEYLGVSDQRVKFLTGFTGSFGIAVTCEKNALFTDSRYFIQAKNELKNYELKKYGIDLLDEYINRNILVKRVGLNPRHYSKKYITELSDKLKKYDIEIVFILEDLVDKLFENKPKRIFNKIYSIENYTLKFFYRKNFEYLQYKGDYKKFMMFDLPDDALICGKTYTEKLEEVRKFINDDEELIITEMDTICWLFNLRGSDIKYNPLFYGYACITKKEAKIFCEAELSLKNIEIKKYNHFEDYLLNKTNKFVVSNSCNAYIDSILTNHKYTDQIRNLQTQKSKEELEGFNLAYILEGIALTKLFTWINTVYGTLTEKDIALKLEEFRSNFIGYKFPSFESIVGSGPNSAIIHYSAGDRIIKKDEIVLLDVGSNYMFGTTDTSRTLFIGNPCNKISKYYTKILKGQLRAINQTYPKKINGRIIDALTRLDLWNNNENYGHASGHGVGHFLCVHENPPTLSQNLRSIILENQIFSIEPGFYQEDEFGIRLENLVVSQKNYGDFLKLVDITYVPYQLNMIDMSLLTQEEIININRHNTVVREKILPFIQDNTEREYLLRNTECIE